MKEGFWTVSNHFHFPFDISIFHLIAVQDRAGHPGNGNEK
jgi:hypothetical protein